MIKRYLCQTKEEIDYIYEKYCNQDFPTRIIVDRNFEEYNNSISFFFDDKFNYISWCCARCELYNCSAKNCEIRIKDFIDVRNCIRESKLKRLLDE